MVTKKKKKKNYVTDNGYRQPKTISLYITITCNQNEIIMITVIGNQKSVTIYRR